MAKKIISVIEKNDVDALKAYFEALPEGQPLDVHDELVLIRHFCEPAVMSYINRFRLSEEGEIAFIDKAPAEIRLTYINYYGLRETTQKYIIDRHLNNAARDFLHMRHFSNMEYVLEYADAEIIRRSFLQTAFEKDEYVIKLLHHANDTLFPAYVNRGHFISSNVLKVILEEKKLPAFNAFMSRFRRKFRQKSLSSVTNWENLLKEKLADVALPEELQIQVLTDCNRSFVELLLKNTPLLPNAQAVLFKRNYDAEWLKFHVTHVYGIAGYRFVPELEIKLFKSLASKNFDECLTEFRQRDDVSFVQYASAAAVQKYLKSYWLTDAGQVALINRGEANLIRTLISRYSPEHGLCWQAEVALVQICSPEVIRLYTSFHSMCREALDLLRVKSPAEITFYYERHPY